MNIFKGKNNSHNTLFLSSNHPQPAMLKAEANPDANQWVANGNISNTTPLIQVSPCHPPSPLFTPLYLCQDLGKRYSSEQRWCPVVSQTYCHCVEREKGQNAADSLNDHSIPTEAKVMETATLRTGLRFIIFI